MKTSCNISFTFLYSQPKLLLSLIQQTAVTILQFVDCW